MSEKKYDFKVNHEKIMVIEAAGDVVFYDHGGNEYLRINPDNCDQDVIDKFSHWVRSLMPTSQKEKSNV